MTNSEHIFETKESIYPADIENILDNTDSSFSQIYNVSMKEIEPDVSKLDWFHVYTILAKIEEHHIEGDIVEVGVYRGGTANFIKNVVGDTRIIHLCDTWSGLPEPTEEEKYRGMWNYVGGDLNAPYADVCLLFKDKTKVNFYKGIFPHETGRFLAGGKYSFIHLDTDMYLSIINSLILLYPLLAFGGCILIHNYGDIGGVRDAVDDFLKIEKQAYFLFTNSSHCLIQKSMEKNEKD